MSASASSFLKHDCVPSFWEMHPQGNSPQGPVTGVPPKVNFGTTYDKLKI